MSYSNSLKMTMIATLAIGMAASVMAKDEKISIGGALKNAQIVSNTALNPGHGKHDKNGDGRDEHMDGRNGNGYGHSGGHGNPPPNCVPEPASMLAMGAGAGFLAVKRRRAAKKA